MLVDAPREPSVMSRRKLSLRKASPFIDPISETDMRFCEPTVRVPVQFLESLDNSRGTRDAFLRHSIPGVQPWAVSSEEREHGAVQQPTRKVRSSRTISEAAYGHDAGRAAGSGVPRPRYEGQRQAAL